VTRFAETLAREAGLTILDVNPLGRGPLNENINFIDVMYNNLESFSTALNCKA
jgi:ABC-type Zn uptake system ZnuABC Zn-binding protein ZnuA